MGRPHQSYIVAATPRSGSTLLCEALAHTGIAGRPAEYFEALRGTDTPRQPRQYFDEVAPDLEALLPLTDQEPAEELARAETYADYLRWALEAGTTPNGVFGAKIMWGHVHDFAGRLRELPDHEGTTDEALVRQAFPHARFVRIVRAGKIEQAVSLWKAIQTQHWRAGEDGARHRRAPAYHEGAIRSLAQRLYRHERRWNEFFARLRVEPLTLGYDDIVDDLRGSVHAVLEHIGVEAPADLQVEAPLRRQADATSREWIERFIADNRTVSVTGG